MGRMFNYPELLLIALFVIVPPLFGLLWHSSTIGLLLRMLLGLPAAFLIWLAIIFLFVWPRYRNR